MKTRECNPEKGVQKKTSKRWLAIVIWVCVAVIPCAILLWLYVEGKYYEERFHETKIADKGTLFIDMRLKKVEQLGGKTFVVTEMSASAKEIKDPERLTVTVDSVASKRGNTYSLIGNYDCRKEHFKGNNKEIRIHPISGSPSWFPFDDLSFDMSFTIAAKTKIAIPDPPFSTVHLYQAQEGTGYVIKNTQFDPINNSADKGAKIHIKFLLARKLFAKIAFIVYAFLVLLYVVIALCSIKKFDNNLLMSVVGFFISIWAVRQGLNSFSKGYITVVDYFFLIVPLAVLLVILAKILIYHYTIEDPARGKCPDPLFENTNCD